nr:hypothetical protein [Thermococcus sp. M36]
MIGRRENRVDFVSDLITLLLTEELYSDEALFRDVVEEVYRILREEVLKNGRKELIAAYEAAVVLRASVRGDITAPEQLLRSIKRSLGGVGSAL